MELPLARGPRAACCLPALPTSSPCKVPGCPTLGTGRGVLALNFSRSRVRGTRAGKGPLQAVSLFCPHEDGRRDSASSPQGQGSQVGLAGNKMMALLLPQSEGRCWLGQPRGWILALARPGPASGR